MSRFQNLIDQLIDLTVDLNHELKAAGLDQDGQELWGQAGRATDAICLLETALVDAELVDGARTEEEAMGPAKGAELNEESSSRSMDIGPQWSSVNGYCQDVGAGLPQDLDRIWWYGHEGDEAESPMIH